MSCNGCSPAGPVDVPGARRASAAAAEIHYELNVVGLNAAVTAQPPGPIPIILRIVSTIPREKALLINDRAAGRLEFSSKVLRCDAAFCGRPALEEIGALAGVKSVSPIPDPVSPGAIVEYDEASISREQLVARISAIIGSLQDPLYDGQVVVRNVSN